MRVLHLSDTSLSGSAYRLSGMYNKYSGHESRQIVWLKNIFNRVFPYDMEGLSMTVDELNYWVNEWADIIHFHNRWKRQEIFRKIPFPVNKPSVIQVHSPRFSKSEDDFKQELASKVPLAIIAQYHVRQWPEKRFIVPNVVDIFSPDHMPKERTYRNIPLVSYAPSNCNCSGWDDKSYGLVNSRLRKMAASQQVYYSRLVNLPHVDCLAMKQDSDIGIDEVATGSYHMSTLEYLSMGVATIVYTDPQTERVVKDLTGCIQLPWQHNGQRNIDGPLKRMMYNRSFVEFGQKARKWMETNWNPDKLCAHFTNMYEKL